MTNAFEYGDALLPQAEEHAEGDEPASPPPLAPNLPYLNLATYVPCIVPINGGLDVSADSGWSC